MCRLVRGRVLQCGCLWDSARAVDLGWVTDWPWWHAADDRDVALDADLARAVGDEQDVAGGDVRWRVAIDGGETALSVDDDDDGEGPLDRDRLAHARADDLGAEEVVCLGGERPGHAAALVPATSQGGDAVRRHRGAVDTLECYRSRQVQEGVLLLEPEPSMLQHDGEVGRLLELEDEDALADRVWLAGRHQHRVAPGDPDRVQSREEALVLGVDEVGQLVGLEPVAEADPHRGPSDRPPGRSRPRSFRGHNRGVARRTPGPGASGPEAARRCPAAW